MTPVITAGIIISLLSVAGAGVGAYSSVKADIAVTQVQNEQLEKQFDKIDEKLDKIIDRLLDDKDKDNDNDNAQ